MDQRVSYALAKDGVSLAYAVSGEGPPLVRAATWLTHIEHDWSGPIWGHWCSALSENNKLIRYDERGCGLSSRDIQSLTMEDWITDLETVVDHLELEEFNLLGMSQGGYVAMNYAARHPERVKKLSLVGTGPISWREAQIPDMTEKWQALNNLAKAGWGELGSTFVQPFAHMFVPEAEPKHIDWFASLTAQTATKEVAGLILEVMAEMTAMDAIGVLKHLDIPTQIIHSERDAMVPLFAGQALASMMPKSEFLMLDSANHILLADEPAFPQFVNALDEFLRRGEAPLAPPSPAKFDALTKRENEILTVMARGAGNGEIADALFISEKTVRNHVTSILDKLGVDTRAKAIVLAKDMGL